jgi:hypothetical protein
MRLEVFNTRSVDGEYRWKSLDEFHQTYWSGLDAQVFAGDVFLDELITLQWRLDEVVAPLFSYASYTYDSVMHGARRVSGSFMINFKRQGYLYELLEQWDKKVPIPNRAPRDWTRDEAFRLARHGHATVEDLTAMAGQAGFPVRNLGGFQKLDHKTLGRVADAFEKAIWDEPQREKSPQVQSVRGALTARTESNRPRFRLSHPVELAIHFGSVAQQGASARVQGAGLVGYGGDTNENAALPVGTSLKLSGVVLTSREQVLDDSGRPVLENYGFIARDVI